MWGTRNLLGITVWAVSLFEFAPSAAAQASLYDCDDFDSQEAAQDFFDRTGGQGNDPYYLDGDDDGIACEWGVDRDYPYADEQPDYEARKAA